MLQCTPPCNNKNKAPEVIWTDMKNKRFYVALEIEKCLINYLMLTVIAAKIFMTDMFWCCKEKSSMWLKCQMNDRWTW
jgi:hypothetical protein